MPRPRRARALGFGWTLGGWPAGTRCYPCGRCRPRQHARSRTARAPRGLVADPAAPRPSRGPVGRRSGPRGPARPLLASIAEHYPEADLGPVDEAFDLAVEAHDGQRRATGEPYVTHPIASAQILADLGVDPIAIEAALLHDVPEDTEYSLTDVEERFGAEVAQLVDGVDEALEVQHPQPRAAAGREHPQDVPGDGPGHPGRPHQARRPPPQHAHAVRAPVRQAAAHRPPDDGDLRAARRAARDLADEVGARGPRVQGARAGALPRARQAARHAAQGPRELHRAGHRRAPAAARGGRDRGRHRGTPEAHLQHLEEDAAQERGVRRDLRRLRHPPARRRGARLLRGARDRPLAVAPDPGPVRRLHRGPQEQPLPVAPHGGHRDRRQAARDPDPDPPDAPGVRGRHRRALALQGGDEVRSRVRRQARLAPPAHGLAARRHRRDRVRRGHQARHLPGPGLRVHAQGRHQGPARRRDAARLRLPHPHRRRPPHDRRARSTTGSCRSTTGSRTATSSRS